MLNKLRIFLDLTLELLVLIIVALFIFGLTAMIFGGLSFFEPLVLK